MTPTYTDVVAATSVPFKRWSYARVGKRVLDVGLVILILPVVLPLIASILLLVWLKGGAPLYSQLRVGRGGKTFR